MGRFVYDFKRLSSWNTRNYNYLGAKRKRLAAGKGVKKKKWYLYTEKQGGRLSLRYRQAPLTRSCRVSGENERLWSLCSDNGIIASAELSSVMKVDLMSVATLLAFEGLMRFAARRTDECSFRGCEIRGGRKVCFRTRCSM